MCAQFHIRYTMPFKPSIPQIMATWGNPFTHRTKPFHPPSNPGGRKEPLGRCGRSGLREEALVILVLCVAFRDELESN